MNQTLSTSRFGRLLRTHLSDNRGQLITGLALLTGLLLAFAVLFANGLPIAVERNRSIMFFFLGWPTWFVFIWQQTEVLNHRERAFAYLLRPASTVEKFTLIWLVTGLGFVTIYLLVFALIDAGLIAYVNNREWSATQLTQIQQWGNVRTMKPFFREERFLPPAHILVLTGLLHPVCILLFLTVKRYSLPIVGVLILLILGGGYLLNTFLLNQLLPTPEVVTTLPFREVAVMAPTGAASREIGPVQPTGNQLRYAVGILAIALLYLTAYFRLKEREV